jgi:hypothetical protein
VMFIDTAVAVQSRVMMYSDTAVALQGAEL